jgi:hypothetical protein
MPRNRSQNRAAPVSFEFRSCSMTRTGPLRRISNLWHVRILNIGPKAGSHAMQALCESNINREDTLKNSARFGVRQAEFHRIRTDCRQAI